MRRRISSVVVGALGISFRDSSITLRAYSNMRIAPAQHGGEGRGEGVGGRKDNRDGRFGGGRVHGGRGGGANRGDRHDGGGRWFEREQMGRSGGAWAGGNRGDKLTFSQAFKRGEGDAPEVNARSVEGLIREREDGRKSRDYKTADGLRDELVRNSGVNVNGDPQMLTKYRLFAGVTPGFEMLLSAELSRITNGSPWRTTAGGAEGLVSRDEMWAVAHRSRLAELLRVRIGEFRASTFSDLVAKLERLPWSAYIKRGIATMPIVSAIAYKSRLIHTGAIRERVLAALYNRGITTRPPPPHIPRPATATGAARQHHLEGPERLDDDDDSAADASVPRIFVRLHHDVCTVSIDASGPQLHKRGYRLDIGTSPLRETLAAACLHAVQADLMDCSPTAPPPDMPPLLQQHRLWDPMCGSGTIVIEAVASALELPAVIRRRMAFQDWPTHTASHYESFVHRLGAPAAESDVTEQLSGEGGGGGGGGGGEGGGGGGIAARPLLPAGHAVASDIDQKAIASATRNGERANVNQCITWVHADILDKKMSAVPHATVVLVNMPYGKRLQTTQAARARLEQLIKQRQDLRVYVIAPREVRGWGGGHALGDKLGECSTATTLHERRWREILAFQNRGIPVALVRAT